MDFKMWNCVANSKTFHLESNSLFGLRLSRGSFSRNSLSFFISFGFKSIVLFNSLKKSFSTVTFSNMFNSYMNSLFNFSLFNLFVKNKTKWSRIHIEDSGSSSMIEMMRHASVNSTINNNIDIVTNSMGL